MWKTILLYALRSVLLLSLVFVLINPAYARGGCCSWHGGVASCDSSVGRLICNDGTYSPSCTCPISQSTSKLDISKKDYDENPNSKSKLPN